MAVEDFRSEQLTRRRALLGAVSACLGPAAKAADAVPLLFDQLYKGFGVRGYEFSGIAVALNGKPVSMRGHMAPPLKPESRFFVLTRQPVALCPFCQSDADWPVDIVVIYLKSTTPLISAGEPVTVSGRLEVGPWTDPATGFVSQIRIVDATFWRD